MRNSTLFPRRNGTQAAALAAGTALACLAGAAQAALTVYTTAASFASATTVPYTDSFSDLALDFAASPLTRINGAYGYTTTANGGLFGAGTAADIWLSTSLSGAVMRFGDFTGGVRGLGGLFFGSDAAGAFAAGQSFTLTATDSVGASLSATLNNATTGSFVGFVSDALLVSVSLTPGALGSWATVNNLVLTQAPGAPIPEPGRLGLLLGGLGAVGAFRLRQRKA